MSKRRRRQKAAAKGLASGAGSGTDQTLHAPDGFERQHVLDVEGRPSTVIRRIDNLIRLRAVLGSERVNALICLRMATEAMERGLTPRCGLDMSPGAGPDGFLALIQHRLDASLVAGLLWGAVDPEHHVTVRLVVVQGASVEQAAAAIVSRRIDARRRVHGQLEQTADAVQRVLDQRYGRAKMRVA